MVGRDGGSIRGGAPSAPGTVLQGDVWWAELASPSGSEPGFRRPVLVVQGDAFNRSRLATTVCVVLTSAVRLADAPGNVMIPKRTSGLPKDSVANVSQVVTIDRRSLSDRAGRVTPALLHLVLAGLDTMLGR